MKFAVAVVQLMNIHDLNNESPETIRTAPVFYPRPDGGFVFAPETVVVSGCMLKSHHHRAMVEVGNEQGIPFCYLCAKGYGIRLAPPEFLNYLRKLGEPVPEEQAEVILGGREHDVLELCAGCDVHGFLRPQPPVLRRDSTIWFSFCVPLWTETDQGPSASAVLTHSRVLPEIAFVEEKAEEAVKEAAKKFYGPIPVGKEALAERVRQVQMVYHRMYASEVGAWTSVLDVDRVGVASTTGVKLPEEERRKRARAAILAYAPLLHGAMGASLARALPTGKALSVVAFVSRSLKVPFVPPHPAVLPNGPGEAADEFAGFVKLYSADGAVVWWSDPRMAWEPPSPPEGVDVLEADSPAGVLKLSLEYLGLSE